MTAHIVHRDHFWWVIIVDHPHHNNFIRVACKASRECQAKAELRRLWTLFH